ncbi:MAG: DEAD/DEAH box helicase, partial [Leptospiraceae bacterium]|nr:DEAD/DEAH box helicase [Leptospiraceae bacterium]
RYLVLDEADRMFDMGFIRDVRYIMRHVPTEAQCMLFSATLSYYVMRLASDFMKDPVEVRIESETVAVDKIDQHIVHLGREERDPYLVNLMREQENIRAIVFTNYKQAVRRISNVLRKYGIAAAGISSLLDQKKRIRLLKDFKLGRHSVLVATDVASRGLDVEDITHVFNYDLPQDSESYVHRIGRTARAGRSGTSISFCSESDYENLPRIEKYLERKIPVMEVRDELLQFPQGVEPFREARGADAFDDTAETKEQNDDSAESGRSRSGRRRRRGGRGRGERSESTNEQSANTRSNEGRGRRNRDEAPAQLDERDLEGMTVRERDRAAVLGRLNTRDDQSGSGEGNDGNRNRRRRRRGRRSGRRDDQNTESTSREERPNRNQNERDGSGGERSSGNRRRRGGRRQNRDRDREGTGRNRDGRSRRDSGSQSGRRDSTKRAATTEKKGLFDRIRGWLRKS